MSIYIYPVRIDILKLQSFPEDSTLLLMNILLTHLPTIKITKSMAVKIRKKQLALHVF